MNGNEGDRGKAKKKSISFTIHMNSLGDALNPQNFSIENNNLPDRAMKWVV